MTMSIESWQSGSITIALPDIPNNSLYFALCIGIYILVETVGNGLLVSIILLEKYGGDSKKRTLINQLTTQICLMVILSNLASPHFIIYRLIIAALSK